MKGYLFQDTKINSSQRQLSVSIYMNTFFRKQHMALATGKYNQIW